MGIVNDEISRIRDSLLVFGRIMPYVTQSTAEWFPKELKPRLKTLRQDVASLSDYDAHLTIKVQFLLDAVLGFISIAQANIIKVMTVVGVVGVPPTLIASIYGMNFTNMPELHWAWGYPRGAAPHPGECAFGPILGSGAAAGSERARLTYPTMRAWER